MTTSLRLAFTSCQPELLREKARSRSDGSHVLLYLEEEGSEKFEGTRLLLDLKKAKFKIQSLKKIRNEENCSKNIIYSLDAMS